VPPDVQRWAVKQVHPLSRPVVKNHDLLDTLKGATVLGIHSIAGALPIPVEEAAKLGCSRRPPCRHRPVRVPAKTSADRQIWRAAGHQLVASCDGSAVAPIVDYR
jgi:hypothetical protein